MPPYCSGNRGMVWRDLIAFALMWLLRSMPASGNDLDRDQQVVEAPFVVAARAMAAANSAVDEALEAGNLWSDTTHLLIRAAAYQKEGDYSQAVQLARVARRHATMALNQARLERARYLLSELANERKIETLNAVRAFLRASDGDAALRLMRELTCN